MNEEHTHAPMCALVPPIDSQKMKYICQYIFVNDSQDTAVLETWWACGRIRPMEGWWSDTVFTEQFFSRTISTRQINN